MIDGRVEFDRDLASVAKEVSYIKKSGWNDAQNYAFARAEDVYQGVNAGLSDRGISISSSSDLLHYGSRELEGRNGKRTMQYAVVRVTLKLTRGEHFAIISGLGESADTGDKSVMKAMTAATKYALSTGFLVAWGDTDPEQDTSVDRAVSGKDTEEKPKKTRAKKEAGPSRADELTAAIKAATTTAELEAAKKLLIADSKKLSAEERMLLVEAFKERQARVGGTNGAATAQA